MSRTSKMAFTQLPAELQIDIFSYLQATDLKAARGVSREFRDHVSPSLFRSVVACARYKALSAFQNISLHSVCRAYVKEIVFDASAYNALLAKSEAQYQRMADQHQHLRGVVSWERRVKFKRYQQLFQEQKDIKDGHVLLQTIARALEWMPNVFSIIYSPGPHHLPIERKLMKDVLPRDVRSADQDSIHYLIGALAIAQHTGVREFKIDPLIRRSPTASRTGFTLAVFNIRDPTHLEAGKDFFRQLTTVSFDLSLSAALTSSTDDLACLANMAALLAEAKELRQLSLHFSGWDPDPHRMYGQIVRYGDPIYPHFGLGVKWPRLRSLSLKGVFAEEEELRDLISRHADTLVSLSFGYCSLFSGHWSSVVDDVVYGTRISPFVLDHVNETTIGKNPFRGLSNEEMGLWQYEGQIHVDGEGERFFNQPEHKSVYAWRKAVPSDE